MEITPDLFRRSVYDSTPVAIISVVGHPVTFKFVAESVWVSVGCCTMLAWRIPDVALFI